MSSRAADGSPVEMSTRSVSRFTSPGMPTPTDLIGPVSRRPVTKLAISPIRFSGWYAASRRPITSPAEEITTPRIVVGATSIPAKLVPVLFGMRESLSCELRSLGQAFRRHLIKGVRGCQPPRLRVECPRTEPMTDTTDNSQAGSLPLRKVLVPTDFSGCANYALSDAASIARATGANIICVHVVEPIVPAMGYTGLAEPMPIADISEQLEDSAERELPQLAKCEEFNGLDVEEVIVHGDAAAEIVRVARVREVDLIVVSSTVRTGPGRI